MKQKISKLALITFSGEGFSIAKRFQDEGGEVVVGIVDDQKDIYTPEELKKMEADGKDPSDEGENGETKKLRMSTYDGVFEKYDAQSVVEFLEKQDDKDSWFVFCDMNYVFKYGEQLSKFMPHGIFPTQEDRELESDREKAKEFIAQNYPDIAAQKVWEFKTVDETKDFLQDADEIFVLKGNNPDAPTVVPPNDDVDSSREFLLHLLDENKDTYNAGGMILEVKLTDAFEYTPERIYCNGEEISTSLDIETKKKYAGDVGGELVGCGTDMVLLTDMDDKINRVAFPDIVDEMAAKHKSMFIWDLSLFVSPRTKKMYPGEFCANRVGYDDITSQMEGVGPMAYFNDIVNMKNPLEGKKVSCSVRVMNDEKDLADRLFIFPDEIAEHIWPMDAKMKDGKWMTAGYDSSACVITGHGDNFKSAVNMTYDSASKFSLATKRWGYRSKGDYLDSSYNGSILARYNYAVDNGLITGFTAYSPSDDDGRMDAMKDSYEQKLRDKDDKHKSDLRAVRDEIKSILNG